MMLKKLFCILSFIFISATVHAIDRTPIDTVWVQNYDSMSVLLTEVNYNECVDVYYNAIRLIPNYYSAKHLDSIHMIIGYVDLNCSGYKNLLLTKILLSIKQKSFSEKIYSNISRRFFDNPAVILFEDFLNNKGKASFLNEEYFDKDDMYFQFLTGLSKETKTLSDSNSLEYLWSLFLAGEKDDFIHEVTSSKYNGTIIQDLFNEALKNIRENYRYQYSISFGGWYPDGNLKHVGDKFELGLYSGLNFNDVQLSMYVIGRPGNSKGLYDVKRNDGTIVATNDMHNLELGLDLMVPFKRTQLNSYYLIFGLGMEETFSIADYSDDDRIISKSSLGLNVGLEYVHYWNLLHKSNISFFVKYNVSRFDDKFETNLSGNAISAGVKFGWRLDKLFSTNRYPFW